MIRVDKFFRANERQRRRRFGDDEQEHIPNRYRRDDELTIEELEKLEEAKGDEDDDD